MYVRIDGTRVLRYPYSTDDLKRDNPNVTFSVAPAAGELQLFGAALVYNSTPPEHSPAQRLEESTPMYNTENSRWEQVWTVRDKSAEELSIDTANKTAEVRSERNNRLARSDWTQVLDAQVDRAAWATYRQALRDITAQPGFPWEVTWPQEP